MLDLVTECESSHFSLNACLAPLCAMQGMAVTTVEGIGSIKRGLHPVQERLAHMHGSQCGFCTPGIVMSMYTLLRNNPRPSAEAVEHAFAGNLCRCTGYRPILDAYKTFSPVEGEVQAVCPSTGKPCDCGRVLNQEIKVCMLLFVVVQADWG